MLQLILVLGLYLLATATGSTIPTLIESDAENRTPCNVENSKLRTQLWERNLEILNLTLMSTNNKLDNLENRFEQIFNEMDRWKNSSVISLSRDRNQFTLQFQKSVNVTNDEHWVDHRDEEKIYFTDIWENDEPKVCKVNNATNLVCSKLSLSETCADSNAINCRGSQCRIKNHIYGPKSFWVTCDGDWTIIQRRMNGSVDFERNWQSYKEGFGDLDGEFWLGLDKIHSLTALYGGTELMIEMQDFDNIWRQAYYESFRVGNEATTYLLEVKGSIKSTAGDSFTIHSREMFSTHDSDNDKNSGKNCAATLRGAWWYYKCDLGHNISNLNGFYYNLSVVPADKPASGIVWKTFRGAGNSLKFVQMKIRPKQL